MRPERDDAATRLARVLIAIREMKNPHAATGAVICQATGEPDASHAVGAMFTLLAETEAAVLSYDGDPTMTVDSLAELIRPIYGWLSSLNLGNQGLVL